MKILLIDNRDSFTFNLADALCVAGVETIVLRNNVSADAAFDRARTAGAAILLSPGPGAPEEAGCCIDLIALAKGRVPLAGICLGHQAIVAQAGGRIERVTPHHGKIARLHHCGGLFDGLPDPMTVARYHSLGTPVSGLPARFTVDASLGDLAMAIRDDDAMQLGLQFHPESILTPGGDRLLDALLARLSGWAARLSAPSLACQG